MVAPPVWTQTDYRTVIPERFVYILAAMFIDASSWKSSLAAYGMWICEILVLFLHGRHSKEFFLRFLQSVSAVDPCFRTRPPPLPVWNSAVQTYATGVISPQMSQMCTRKASDTSNSRSFKNALAPCEIMQSRSISPKRSPPSRARPSTGCLVSICTGPLARAWILSSTMCRKRW